MNETGTDMRTWAEELRRLRQELDELPAPRKRCPYCDPNHCPACGQPIWPTRPGIWL